MTKTNIPDIQNIRNKNLAPRHRSPAEKAWNSVKWMTGKKAEDAVREFIRSKQT